jgi:hypothetical protein
MRVRGEGMSKEYIKDLMNDVESLVLFYESTLKENGIKCTISKKYFETKADLECGFYPAIKNI